MRSPRIALALAAGLVAVLLACPVPVLDEESYLDIGRQLDPLHPYDWWRPWQPWGLSRPDDAFVYAHPPLFLLWVRAWLGQAGDGVAVGAIKAAAALPWAMLLGWSAGRLCERLARRPWQAAAVWLTAPITILGMQRGLMPDLMVTSLGAVVIVSWLEALGTQGPIRTRWLLMAGVGMGMAALTKYPALVLLLPVLAHARALGRRRDAAVVTAAFAVVFLVGEGGLWLTYGRVHVLEVLARSSEIGRGPPAGRTLGALARLGLLSVSALPLLLLPWARAWLPALVTGGLLSLLGCPAGTPPLERLLMGLLGGVGAHLLWRAVAGLRASPERAAPADPDDTLLSVWALAVIGAVVVGHNYAAPRYLMPAMVPLALLIGRQVERRLDATLALTLGTLLQAGLGLGLTVAEHRFAEAQVAAADAAIAAAKDAGMETPGHFSGEWSFRWRMEQRGWSWWGGQQLPPGTAVVSATEAGPRALPPTWVERGRFGRGRFGLRVLDAAAGVALYSETAGTLPVGWSGGLLEEAVLWQTE